MYAFLCNNYSLWTHNKYEIIIIIITSESSRPKLLKFFLAVLHSL